MSDLPLWLKRIWGWSDYPIIDKNDVMPLLLHIKELREALEKQADYCGCEGMKCDTCGTSKSLLNRQEPPEVML